MAENGRGDVVSFQRVRELLDPYEAGGENLVAAWEAALVRLQRQGRGVIPRSVPAHGDRLVATFDVAQDPVGPLLEAASRLGAGGGRQSAEATAQAARAVKEATNAPEHRIFREDPPAADAAPATKFWHRVNAQGGFLAITVGEVEAELGYRPSSNTTLPRPLPADAGEWVVLWDRLSVPGMVLQAVADAYSAEDDSGVELLRMRLEFAGL